MPDPAWLDRAEWPWETRYVAVGEDRAVGHMAYVDVGHGPIVVLSHGTPTWGYEWRHVIRALSATHRVIVPDHLGFGLSDRPAAAAYGPEAHAERFSAFLRRVVGTEPIALAVHDFGGPFALPAALDLAREGRLRHLLIANSFAWSFDDDPRMRRLAWLAGTGLWRFLYGYLNLSVQVITPSAWGDKAGLTPKLRAQIEGPWASGAGPGRTAVGDRQLVLWALAQALGGSSAHYEAIRARLGDLAGVPTAIVWGLADSAFPPDQLAKWRKLVPHAAVTELPKAGHWPHEEDPDAVIGAFRALLSTTR